MADLEGGTTGQVLAKNSNTDMDFIWVTSAGDIEGVTAGTGISGGGTSGTVTITNSMATAIDAKGDLVAGTAADTFSRIGVGANGTVLTADSVETTGLKWVTPLAPTIDYTLINSGGTALSGSSATTINVSGKNSILVIITGATTAAGAPSLIIRPNANATAANYYKWEIQSANATMSFPLNSIGATSWFKLAQANTGGTDTMTGIFKIDGANGTGYKPVLAAGTVSAQGASSTQQFLQGSYNQAAAITSIQVTTLSADFTAGTIYVYGA